MGDSLTANDKKEIARLKKKVADNEKSLKTAHTKLQKMTDTKTKQLSQTVDELKTLADAIVGLHAKHKLILDRQEQQIKNLG
jgi:acetyl-CoA carboxylase alpha subunit